MIPQWVAKYVGVPFLDKGRSSAGYDCWGLVRAVLLEQFAIEMPTFDAEYMSHKSDEQVAHLFLSRTHGWTRVTEGQPGDIIIFRWKGQPAHIGVIYERGWFLHALLETGVVRESYRSAKYEHRVWCILRHASRSQA